MDKDQIQRAITKVLDALDELDVTLDANEILDRVEWGSQGIIEDLHLLAQDVDGVIG